MPDRHTSLRRHSGFNLIELMISMMLGLFIIGTITQIFLSGSISNRTNYQLGLMQEAARIAMSSIRTDVRMAGYTGCDGSVELGNALQENNTNDQWVNAEQLIQGMNNANTITRVDSAASSESLLIFKLDPSRRFQITGHNTSSQTMTLNQSANGVLTTGMPVGLTRQDCTQVSLVAMSSVSNTTVAHQTGGSGDFRNCVTSLKGNFRCYDSTSPTRVVSFNPGYLSPVKSVAYFVKEDNGLPTLFRREADDGATQAVVDGIEDFRIYYGLDTNNNGSPNRYIRAGDRVFRHVDWNRVLSLRIHLLTRSGIELLPPATLRTYFFDGTNITQTDRFLRREYVLTMALRNDR